MYSIECPYLSLDQIYNSGQVFRWIKVNDGKYIVTNGNDAVKVTQTKDRLLFNCSEDEFYSIWFDYFDMKADYSHVNYRIKSANEYFKICSVRGKGIHIVKQDPFEVLVTSYLRAGKTIHRTRAMLDTLCSTLGTKHKQGMMECGKVCWYSFPSAQDIVTKQNKLAGCHLYNEGQKIVELAELVHEGWIDFEELSGMKYQQAKEYLMQFDGLIDENVAEYFCLYALHHMKALPYNECVEQILVDNFETDSLEEVCGESSPKLMKCLGLIHQYIYHDYLTYPR